MWPDPLQRALTRSGDISAFLPDYKSTPPPLCSPSASSVLRHSCSSPRALSPVSSPAARRGHPSGVIGRTATPAPPPSRPCGSREGGSGGPGWSRGGQVQGSVARPVARGRSPLGWSLCSTGVPQMATLKSCCKHPAQGTRWIHQKHTRCRLGSQRAVITVLMSSFL